MIAPCLFTAVLWMGQAEAPDPPAREEAPAAVRGETDAATGAAVWLATEAAATPLLPPAMPIGQAPDASTPTKSSTLQLFAPELAPKKPADAAAVPPTTPPDRWYLQRAYQGTGPGVCLDTERTSIYGWAQVSSTLSSVNNLNLPVSFNYRAGDPLLQQFWARINRSVVTTGTTEPTFGYNIDTIYGTDYRFTLARGLWNKQLTDRDGLPATYGFDPVQFYGEAYIPTIGRGLDVKVGRFYVPFGVESLEAVSTPFLSHTYTFSNAPPFTLTGLLCTQNLPYNLIVQFGLVTGEDIFIDPADEPTFIGTIQWSQPGNRNIVKVGAIIGSAWFNQNDGFSGVAGNPNFNNLDIVWTHTFNPVLVTNVEAIYGYMNNIPDAVGRDGRAVPIGTANWFGVVGYASYTVSPQLIANIRAEVFDDPQGVRTLTNPDDTVDDTKGVYTALTLGVTYKPIRQPSNNGILLVRPEVRWDHNWDSKPFGGGGAHSNLFTVGTDVILRW